MNTCIKCGREIPDGELFCNDCALNPGASETVQKPAPALSGRMQKPVVHPPKPKPQPQLVQPTPPKRRTGHGVVIAILCVFTVLSLSLSIYLLANSASQRVSLRLRPSKKPPVLRVCLFSIIQNHRQHNKIFRLGLVSSAKMR